MMMMTMMKDEKKKKERIEHPYSVSASPAQIHERLKYLNC